MRIKPIIKFNSNETYEVVPREHIVGEKLFVERNGTWYRTDTGEPIEVIIMSLEELIKFCDRLNSN